MQNFSPFPLRARGSLEIFDAAIKLYKQYFLVLLGWSAIVSVAGLVGSVIPFAQFFVAIFLTPILVGAVVCCIAAAVRGQTVGFKQCWNFAQPRYWTMALLTFLMWLVTAVVITVMALLGTGIFVGAASAFGSTNPNVQLALGVAALIAFVIVITIISTVLFSWMGLVPIVVCMENDKRSTAAMGRAFELLKGNWLRITTLMAVTGLATLAFFAILGGLVALIVGVGQLGDLVQGNGTPTAALWTGIAAMGLAYVVLLIVCTPLYYLILAVFYLDVRVRREALDLEWTAHASAPPEYSAPTGNAPFVPMPSALAQTEYSVPGAPTRDAFATRILSDENNNPSEISGSSMELTAHGPHASTPFAPTPDATRGDV